MAEKRCYTVKDLQEMLDVSRSTVYKLLRQNEFRWIQLEGGGYRISKKSFDEWLDKGKCFCDILNFLRIVRYDLRKMNGRSVKHGSDTKSWITGKTPKVDECPRDGGYAGIKEDRSLLAGS